MRPLHLTTAMLLGACGSSAQAPEESSCEIGLRIQQTALDAARSKAPACTTDSECTVMHEAIACPGSVRIDLCDLAVHRAVLEHYDTAAVSQAMCDATEGNELGCLISASCAAHDAATCRAGQCVFAEVPN